ncbi:hypothetical protein OIU78_027283 [Salix suchowensis]|nr:hypothetical protein OIU78_027283 [Salix suchowensis]
MDRPVVSVPNFVSVASLTVLEQRFRGLEVLTFECSILRSGRVRIAVRVGRKRLCYAALRPAGLEVRFLHHGHTVSVRFSCGLRHSLSLMSRLMDLFSGLVFGLLQGLVFETMICVPVLAVFGSTGSLAEMLVRLRA